MAKQPDIEEVRREYQFRSDKDRFDYVPKLSRVGAHRAVEKAGSGWARFLIAALATVVLIAAGIMFIMLQPKSVSFMDELMKEEAPTVIEVAAEIDPETTVIVLNGTPNENLGLDVDEIINQEGWGTTMFSGDAENRDIEISAVFYSDPADQGLAKGLGEQLGGISFYESDRYEEYGNQLTVLLGVDYAGPGSPADSGAATPSETPAATETVD